MWKYAAFTILLLTNSFKYLQARSYTNENIHFYRQRKYTWKYKYDILGAFTRDIHYTYKFTQKKLCDSVIVTESFVGVIYRTGEM